MTKLSEEMEKAYENGSELAFFIADVKALEEQSRLGR